MKPARKLADWQEEQKLTILRGWARAGYSKREIAKLMGITEKSLDKAIRNYPAIAESLSVSREFCDFAVEESLFKRATGFYQEVKKPYKVKVIDYDDKGKKLSEREDIQIITEQEYFPPELKAQLTWLQCRVPDRWNVSFDTDSETEKTSGVIVVPEVISDV